MAQATLDFILDGLEAALELERELGVRSVPCDRCLLAEAQPSPAPPSPAPPSPPPRFVPPPVSRPNPPPTPASVSVPPSASADKRRLVFLHDRPLSPGGVEMMAKIIEALHLTLAEAPVVVEPPVPPAPISVVLGGLALRKYFPEIKAGPGQWVTLADGRLVLVTYSPEYILRFKAVTSDVRTIKQNMWQSLKAAAQRLRRL